MPFGVTCAWGRATRCLMTTYVTVSPYCYKLHSHSVQYTLTSEWGLNAPSTQGWVSWPYAGCWGLTFMCWGCPNRPIRCFCFLCSVIWRSQTKKLKDLSSHHSTCTSVGMHILFCCCCCCWQLFLYTLLHRFILSCRFTETNKCCTNSARCSTETGSSEILPAFVIHIAASTDESSAIQITNTETQVKINFRDQAKQWVITQVFTFKPSRSKNEIFFLLLRINLVN